MKTKTIDIITSIMAGVLFVFDLWALVCTDKVNLKTFLAIMVVSIVLTVVKNGKLTTLISGTWEKLTGSYFKRQ